MGMRYRGVWFLYMGILLLASSFSEAQLKLPFYFSDHMVIQRGQKINVWGMASPGTTIVVSLNGKAAKTEANAQGHWQLSLPEMEEGGPYELGVKAGDEKIVLKDVYIGDVWLASGQSNMQFPVSQALNAEKEIKEANYPLIRLLQVPMDVALKYSLEKMLLDRDLRYDVDCNWQVCSPQTVGGFSAVAYFFARELYQNLKIPIGIINASMGNTPAEAWTPYDTLIGNPKLKPIVDKWGTAWEQFDQQVEKWLREVEQAKKEGKPEPPYPQRPQREFWRPAGLYNAMIAPFTKFPIKGVIWYQGESNIGRAEEYTILFPALIGSWREAWGIGDFPFLFVQIACLGGKRPPEPPKRCLFCEIREAQLAGLRLPNTGMAVAIDSDPALHPKNKQLVGKRLALAAFAIAYGQKVEYRGPMFEKMGMEGDKARIYFKYTAGGLVCKGEKLIGFSIAGEDGKFVWADAEIEGDTVVVWSDKVQKPVAVRYGWAGNPECNLYNKLGLPAVPFRTDIPPYLKGILPLESVDR